MSKTKQEPGTAIARPGSEIQQTRPEWVPATTNGDMMRGFEGLRDIVRPSFVKIVQKASSSELHQKFGIGSLISSPDQELLCKEGEKISIVPLMFYKEWCKWSSNKLKGIEPTIVARTFDERDPIAVKAKSAATWSEPHPKYQDDRKYDYRYVEHLNFIIRLVNTQFLTYDPMLVSFIKTSYATGCQFGKLLLKRKAPPFMGVYELGTKYRENAEGEFHVFTIDDHKEEPWVTKEAVPELKAQCEEFVDLYERKLIVPDYEDALVEDAPTQSTGEY